MRIKRALSTISLLAVALTACAVPNDQYCEIPQDCLGGSVCIDNACQYEPEPSVDGGVGEDGDTDPDIDAGPVPTMAASVTLQVDGVKTFRFDWTDVPDATHYKLLENSDGNSEFIQVGDDIQSGEQVYEIVVPLYARTNAKYVLQSCNDAGCVDSAEVEVTGLLVEAIGYFKASNTESYDGFGVVSISNDGKTLAIAAPGKDDGSNGAAGAVYVFTDETTGWEQTAYLKASNADEADGFGKALALSGDGNTLVVGAPNEDSNTRTIGGNQGNNSASDSGAAYVFVRNGTSWNQQSYIKATNAGALDTFGFDVAISADGNTIAVGAVGEDSNAQGVSTPFSALNNSASFAGAAYVFTRSGSIWIQQAYVKASNAEGDELFGDSVALSDDGNTLAVGASWEDSNATGVGGSQSNNQENAAGAVYVYTREGTEWSHQAYVKASNTEGSDGFGRTLALSGDGLTLAVSSTSERSNASGIDGNQDDNSTNGAGAVYIFTRTPSSTWSQQAYVKSSNPNPRDGFGGGLALNNDGSTLAVGATKEQSNAIGLGGDQANNVYSLPGQAAGAVYVFTRASSTWSQQAYVKASNTGDKDRFGIVSLSDTGTLAVGASGEKSGSTGIGGDQNDNTLFAAGAVYLY